MKKQTIPFCCLISLLLLLQIACACIRNCELPVLLFFLPWTALLRFSPDSISFYTLALLMVGCIRTFKNKFSLKNYFVATALAITVLTLLAKIIDGYRLANSYLMFLAMLDVSNVGL